MAVGLRMLCTLFPGNYDFESWDIVADLLRRGEPVYTSTYRYNYAPFWMGILWVLKGLPVGLYRIGIIGVLAATDVAIAALLRRLAGPVAAIIFLFNPWSIGISGHHLNFDNIAILVGLLGVMYMARRTGSLQHGPSQLSVRQTVIAAAIFGASLVVKHLFYLFPLWMAFRVQHPAKRAIWLLLPPLVFLLSFLPFWSQYEGIVKNVFEYPSRFNAPLMNGLGPAIFDTLTGPESHSRVEHAVMHAAMLLAGITLRRPPLELLAIYCAVILTFASGTFNHYFAIPVIFVALYPNRWGWLYTALGLIFYLFAKDAFYLGPRLPQAVQPITESFGTIGHIVLVCVMGAALLTHLRPGWERAVFLWARARLIVALRGHV